MVRFPFTCSGLQERQLKLEICLPRTSGTRVPSIYQQRNYPTLASASLFNLCFTKASSNPSLTLPECNRPVPNQLTGNTISSPNSLGSVIPWGLLPAHFRPLRLTQSLKNRLRRDHWSASLTHFVISRQQLGSRRLGVGSECLQRLNHVWDYARYERMPAASGHCPLADL